MLPNIESDEFWEKYTEWGRCTCGEEYLPSPSEAVRDALRWKVLSSVKTGEVFEDGVHTADELHVHEWLPWLAGGYYREREVESATLGGLDKALREGMAGMAATLDSPSYIFDKIGTK